MIRSYLFHLQTDKQSRNNVTGYFVSSINYIGFNMCSVSKEDATFLTPFEMPLLILIKKKVGIVIPQQLQDLASRLVHKLVPSIQSCSNIVAIIASVVTELSKLLDIC